MLSTHCVHFRRNASNSMRVTDVYDWLNVWKKKGTLARAKIASIRSPFPHIVEDLSIGGVLASFRDQTCVCVCV